MAAQKGQHIIFIMATSIIVVLLPLASATMMSMVLGSCQPPPSSEPPSFPPGENAADLMLTQPGTRLGSWFLGACLSWEGVGFASRALAPWFIATYKRQARYYKALRFL